MLLFLIFPFRLLKAGIEILTTWRYFRLCIAPVAIGSAIFAAVLYWGAGMAGQAINSVLPIITDRFPEYSNFVQGVGSVLGTALALILASVTALIGVNIVGLFFFDRLIKLKLESIGVPPADFMENRSFFRSIFHGVYDEGTRLILIIVISILLIPLSLFPILAVPILIVGFFLVGVEIVDLPLSMLRLRFSKRWTLCRKYFWSVSAIGFWYSILIIIPFTGILFLPPVYLATAELIKRMREGEPSVIT